MRTLTHAYLVVRTSISIARHRLARDDRGEGVISAAIAVLIMAALGALMWVGFKALWEDTESNTRTAVVDKIGR
jgi:hypothetical protein